MCSTVFTGKQQSITIHTKEKVTRPGLEPGLTVSKTVVLAITLSGQLTFTNRRLPAGCRTLLTTRHRLSSAPGLSIATDRPSRKAPAADWACHDAHRSWTQTFRGEAIKNRPTGLNPWMRLGFVPHRIRLSTDQQLLERPYSESKLSLASSPPSPASSPAPSPAACSSANTCSLTTS